MEFFIFYFIYSLFLFKISSLLLFFFLKEIKLFFLWSRSFDRGRRIIVNHNNRRLILGDNEIIIEKQLFVKNGFIFDRRISLKKLEKLKSSVSVMETFLLDFFDLVVSKILFKFVEISFFDELRTTIIESFLHRIIVVEKLVVSVCRKSNLGLANQKLLKKVLGVILVQNLGVQSKFVF